MGHYSHKKNSKKREIYRRCKMLLGVIQFRSSHLSLGGKISLIGTILGIISLFIPWIVRSNINSWNAFGNLAGNIGYLLFPVLLILLFIIISVSNKEKIKLHSNISFKDYYIIIGSGIIICFTSIIAIRFMAGIKLLSNNILLSHGPILCLTSGIIICIGGVIMRNHFKKNTAGIITNEASKKSYIDTSGNTKLPF